MRKKLVIIVASPLTENIYQRIGASEFEGLEVHVLDCLAWMKRATPETGYTRYPSSNITSVQSREEFQTFMMTVKPDFLLDFVGRGAFTKIVQETCRTQAVRYISHHLVPFPSAVSRQAPFRRLLRHPLTTARRAYSLALRMLRKENPYPPDIALVAGAKSITPWLATAQTIIHTATPNYFELSHSAEKANDYILFIDDCLPLSFDFQLGDFKTIVTPEIYFPLINNFFARLEKLMQLPVVIAAHPNGKEYKNYADFFAGRRVEFDSTAALAQRCAVALTHYSSAITYPILLQKPLHTLSFSALRRSLHGSSVAYIASLLGRTAFDLEALPEDKELLRQVRTPVDIAAYERYTKDYIIDTPNPGNNPFDNLRKYLLNS